MAAESRPKGIFAGMAVILFAALGCSTVVSNMDPTGKPFPSISGTSLEGESRSFPVQEAQKPMILLIGYTQFSQFDLDRWILGLTQLNVNAEVVEVPTIPGILPVYSRSGLTLECDGESRKQIGRVW